MIIERFYDEALAHASYMVVSGDKAAVVDPARDPNPYYEFAKANKARIVAIFETHPHADFVSSHLEMSKHTGAPIYVSKLVGADYPHEPFDEGDALELNGLRLRALHTPGHSPDSISIVVEERGKDRVVFTGDSLFIGDVGRPDLREKAGHMQAKREEMARQMYHTVQNKFMPMDDEVKVMPAHGAGSLCGKNISDKLESTIGEQKEENSAMQPMSEEAFVDMLLEDQPFIPQYFSYNVALNKQGAPDLQPSLDLIPQLSAGARLPENAVIVDARPEQQFKQGHIQGAINIQEGKSFETWLGTLVAPKHDWHLIAEDATILKSLLLRTAKIGYEQFLRGAVVFTEALTDTKSDQLPLRAFKAHPEAYTIVDVRNRSEVKEGKIFDYAIPIPLSELSRRSDELPTHRPIVVHCAGGYRSAAASSILEKELGEKVKVYDLSEAVKDFSKEGVSSN